MGGQQGFGLRGRWRLWSAFILFHLLSLLLICGFILGAKCSNG